MTSYKWHSEDAKLLSEIRKKAKLSREHLARFHSISIQHIAELEGESFSMFQSEQHKYEIGARVLKIFGKYPSNLNKELNRESDNLLIKDSNDFANAKSRLAHLSFIRYFLTISKALANNIGYSLTAVSIAFAGIYLLFVRQLNYLVSLGGI